MLASLIPNTDPVAFGSTIILPQYNADEFLGYPVIIATVRSGHPGYASMFGWVQFVQCISNASTTDDGTPTLPASASTQEGRSDLSWQLDKVPLFDDLNTPFCYFGADPTLFDAPARVGENEVTWRAQSYLTYISDAVMTRQVTPIVGFSWGFDVHKGAKSIVPLQALDLKTSWNERLGTLRQDHAGWTVEAAE